MKSRTNVTVLAFLICPLLLCMTQDARGSMEIRWYFGTNNEGGCDNSSLWYDADGVTPLSQGCGVQLIQDVDDDGIDPLDHATCLPTGDDQLVTTTDGEALNTFGTYHDGFAQNGVGDGVFVLCADKTGRWLASDDTDLNYAKVYIRVFNDTDCAASTHYGESAIATIENYDCTAGECSWFWNPGSGLTDKVHVTPTPTPTPIPTPTPTP